MIVEAGPLRIDTEAHTAAVHVNRLREKVEENPSKPQRIQTVWGVGYRLNTL